MCEYWAINTYLLEHNGQQFNVDANTIRNYYSEWRDNEPTINVRYNYTKTWVNSTPRGCR